MDNKKLIHIITTSWNESINIDRFVLWYRSFIPDCDITILDNESDIKYFNYLKEISSKYKFKIGVFKSEGKLAEEALVSVRNNYWKKTKEDYHYILVVDLDELVTIYQEDLIYELNQNWDYCRLEGYEVIAEVLTATSNGHCKPVLFKANNISDMNLYAGSHDALPKKIDGSYAKEYRSPKFKLYHFKWANFNEGLERNNILKNKGRSDYSKSNGWAYHYELGNEEHYNYTIGLLNKVNLTVNNELLWFYKLMLEFKMKNPPIF